MSRRRPPRPLRPADAASAAEALGKLLALIKAGEVDATSSATGYIEGAVFVLVAMSDPIGHLDEPGSCSDFGEAPTAEDGPCPGRPG